MITKPESDDQKFIKKDEKESVKNTEEVFETQEVTEVVNNLSDAVHPKNNQQRNLDRETGGVEAQNNNQSNVEVAGFENWQKNQESKEDAWDDSSEEVDRMGSHNPLGTSGKKSMIWRNKKKKLDEKKLLEAASEALAASAAKSASKGYNSANPQQSFVSNLKNLKQDRSSVNDSRGGGMGR